MQRLISCCAIVFILSGTVAMADDHPFASFDRRIERLIEHHAIPGLSLAVTHRGKLVYAQGYGLADTETKEPVTTKSLFRVASVSKPITAVAILQLVEREKLSLDDRIFDVLDWNKEIDAIEDFDERQRQITIRQLLHHRGGWDRNESFDAMFQSIRFAEEFSADPPANRKTVIRAMLRRKLDFDPGQRYAYSNYGYCLLGRAIEKVTGVSYEEYVKRNMLRPLGIETMRIGRTMLAERAEGEVRYYHPTKVRSVFAANLGERVESPYGGWYLESMDSHGGWIATASDLARLAASLDDPTNSPILSAESIEAMYAPLPDDREKLSEPGGYFYSLGWSNRVLDGGKVNHWHNGSLPGTLATMIRRHDGRNFIALINTRHTARETSIMSDLDSLLHEAADRVKEWPE